MIQPALKSLVEEALGAVLPSGELPSSYLVADGAAIDDLTERLCEWEPAHACLYSGELEPDLARAAPYLIEAPVASPVLDWFLETGWGQDSWGVLLRSTQPLREVRRHLRTLTLVRLPDGSVNYFRFYDPRVLRDFLPTCDAAQRETVFGPLADILLEGAAGDGLLRSDGTTREWVRVHAGRRLSNTITR